MLLVKVSTSQKAERYSSQQRNFITLGAAGPTCSRVNFVVQKHLCDMANTKAVYVCRKP